MSFERIEILVVDDNIDDTALTIRALEKSGLINKIHSVGDGVEALDFIYSRNQYSSINIEGLKLILLDLKMPKISGIQVL